MRDGGVWHEMKSWLMDHESRQLEALFVFLNSSCTHSSRLQSCDWLQKALCLTSEANAQQRTRWNASSFSQNKRSGEQFCVEYFPAVLCRIQWTNPEIQSCFCSISLRIQNQWRELNASLRQKRVETTQSHGTGSLDTGTSVPERHKVIGHRLKTEKTRA